MSKHKQTEGKLGQQAWKLVFMNDEFEQDLEKLHNKLSKVKYIEGDNKDTKSDFTPFLEVMVGQMCEKVDMWGEEHGASCNLLGGNLKDQLAERRGLVLFYLLADDVFKSNSDMKNAIKHVFLSIAEKMKKEEMSVY